MRNTPLAMYGETGISGYPPLRDLGVVFFKVFVIAVLAVMIALSIVFLASKVGTFLHTRRIQKAREEITRRERKIAEINLKLVQNGIVTVNEMRFKHIPDAHQLRDSTIVNHHFFQNLQRCHEDLRRDYETGR